MFCLSYEISIIGKAFRKYKRPQGRAGQQAIHEFISKSKILLDLLLLLLAVLEAISIKFYRDMTRIHLVYHFPFIFKFMQNRKYPNLNPYPDQNKLLTYHCSGSRAAARDGRLGRLFF